MRSLLNDSFVLLKGRVPQPPSSKTKREDEVRDVPFPTWVRLDLRTEGLGHSPTTREKRTFRTVLCP